MIKSSEMKEYLSQVRARDITSKIRKQRWMPQYLQRDIFVDVYNYLLVD